jgi:hypothetical protein
MTITDNKRHVELDLGGEIRFLQKGSNYVVTYNKIDDEIVIISSEDRLSQARIRLTDMAQFICRRRTIFSRWVHIQAGRHCRC